jgi:hypothetical protein
VFFPLFPLPIFSGTYHNDFMEGEGTMTYADGAQYQGMWKKNKRNGQGTLKGGNGKIIKRGMWKNDEFQAE